MASRDMWQIEVRHSGLNKYRLIRGSDKYVVDQKANTQRQVWEEMWEKKQDAQQKKREKGALIRTKEEKKLAALAQTTEAQKGIIELEKILHATLSVNDAVDWESLLDKKKFPKNTPHIPELFVIPREPQKTEQVFQPVLGFFDKLFSSLKEKKLAEAEKLFLSAYGAWQEEKGKLEWKNLKCEEEYKKRLTIWKKEKEEFESKQLENNDRILKRKAKYLSKAPDAIPDYCEMVLTNSKYPDFFPQQWDLDYNCENAILIVDYSLPEADSLPNTKEIKYLASKDEFSETKLSTSFLSNLYDSILYQIALRTIHELYEADVVNAIKSIVFNGWVNSVDKATGQNVNACILSVQALKEDFLAINLEKVDPRACFKQLKGVGSSKLHGLSPIAPIISIDKEDRRFISAYGVADELDESVNLAAMDWQDFENLIREVFEKEFRSTGGEVKITQASRDGGVDAVAFDPDPIRGGKIVIQAKRYTNVVGVSAVRDLFGTTVNEGATKGILVTTANFGPDAYEFAKGKPLTLLNGSNLLYLLEKHGHRAKIDIKEAKQILSEQQK